MAHNLGMLAFYFVLIELRKYKKQYSNFGRKKIEKRKFSKLATQFVLGIVIKRMSGIKLFLLLLTQRTLVTPEKTYGLSELTSKVA